MRDKSTQREGCHLQAQESSPEADHTGTPVLDVRTPKLRENKLLCLSHSVQGVLLWRPEVMNVDFMSQKRELNEQRTCTVAETW